MANSLLKLTTTETVVGHEEIPAIPFRPATPGRTAFEMRNVCMFRYNGPGRYVFHTDPMTGTTTGTFLPDALVGTNGGLQGSWSCREELVPVTYPGTPAQPYVPGRTVAVTSTATGYNLGWNAGARSIAFFNGNGYAEFQVRASVVGVICGLNFYDGIDSGYNGRTIDCAFYLARGEARIIQNGAVGVYVGSYTDSTIFRVERSGTEVIWKMDGTEVFTKTTGVPTETGWLEASLFSGDDEVLNPVLVQLSSPDLTAQTGTLAASLPPMSFFGADRAYGALDATLPALTMFAEAGMVTPSFAVGDWVLPPMSFDLTGLTGEIGQINASLPSLAMLAADHPYGEMFARLEPMEMYASAFEGNLNASLSSQGFVGAKMAASTFLVVSMNSTGAASSVFVVQAVVDAELLAEAAAGSTMGMSAIREAVMLSLARSGDVLGVPGSDNETWVVNLDSSGSTNYTNYAFNSFATIGGRHYGAGPDGIFLLDGDTDAGAPIRASVSLGKLDFGKATKKTVAECYVGMSGAGNLFVKVIAEGAAYVYKTRDFSDELQQQRVKFGKGLKTNYVELEIYNEDGADFELDTVEFRVADLSRRI